MSTDLDRNYAYKTLNNIQNQIKLNYIKNKLVAGKFNLMYLNINSLYNKLDDLESAIAEFTRNDSKKTIHFIALTEVRLQEQQAKYFNLPHYTAFFCTRPDGYGGCALFVHDTLGSNIIEKNRTLILNY